jgi:hypothetical protein
MPLEMNTLGDFLQIGPHFYPPRRKGAQVIERGPHGLRLAADPVVTREGQPRGSGFRFWTESQVFAPNEQWNPRQVVIGIMGLGALGGMGWVQKLKYGSQIQAAINASPPNVRVNGSIAASAMASAISQVARRNMTAFDKDRNRAVQEIGKIRQKGGAARLAQILEQELNENVLPLAQRHLSRSPEEQAKYMKGVTASEQQWVQYRDPDAILQAMEAAEAARECSWYDVSCHLRKARKALDPIERGIYCASNPLDWDCYGKQLLVAGLAIGAGVAAYGLAYGFGSGVGKRIGG